MTLILSWAWGLIIRGGLGRLWSWGGGVLNIFCGVWALISKLLLSSLHWDTVKQCGRITPTILHFLAFSTRDSLICHSKKCAGDPAINTSNSCCINVPHWARTLKLNFYDYDTQVPTVTCQYNCCGKSPNTEFTFTLKCTISELIFHKCINLIDNVKANVKT